MSDAETRKAWRGTGGGHMPEWDRWWPRLTAAGQFTAGLGTFIHEVVRVDPRDALLFWAVALMTGSPALSTALGMLGERLGSHGVRGGSSPPPSGVS